MTILQKNSGFFLDKRSEKSKDPMMRRNSKAIILFLVSVIYGLFIYFIIHIESGGHQNISMLALYVYGLVGGFGFLILNQFYTSVDRSRRILTEVLEKSAEARAITDPDGNTIYANQRFSKLMYGEETPSLHSFTKIFEDSEGVEKGLEELKVKAVTTGSATSEFQTGAEGKPLWIQVTCQHIAGWTGFIHWRFEDTTNHRQMEAAIREEREKLRDFTDNAPVGFFSVDEEGKFLFANDMLFRLLGTDSSSLIGKATLHDFLVSPPQDSRPYDCFNGGGLNQHGELMMKGPKNRVFKAAITHSITKSENGMIISRSVVYDLTAEQKMQQALTESEDRFQRLFEEAPVGICMLNDGKTVSDANQTLGAMLHLPADALNGRPLIRYISEESHKRVEEWLLRLSRDEKAEAFIEVPMKGGQNIVTQLYARKFKDSNDFVLHFIDLTEQKNLEKQFTQSQKMQAVGQLAGGIAHDFNNLLTAMIGFADLLLLRHKPGDPSFSDIMQIKQNANRAANLVRQLLAFSRQQTLQPRILDLADVFTELYHLLRRLIGVNIDLSISHGSELGLVKADQGQIEQVLINLVVNARDAMPQGGKLIISTDNLSNPKAMKLNSEESLPPGEWVTVSVEDTGTGIPPDVLPRIFEPFFTTKDVGAGTGLGLATAYGIIHQTGGYITVKSAVGKGTTFTLFLPLHKEEEREKKAAITEEKPAITDLTGSAKILLVEDEDAVRIFSARALSNKGYQVLDAASGAQALQMLEEKQIEPEVLITDVMMPEMDGTTLAKIVREKYPQIKIIFISGYAEDRFKEHLGQNVYFLPKPFTLKQLATKVKEVIED